MDRRSPTTEGCPSPVNNPPILPAFPRRSPSHSSPFVGSDVRNRPPKNLRTTPPSHLAPGIRHDARPPAPQPPSPNPNPNPAPPQPPRLLDRMRAEIRTRHYSLRTEQAYVDWARRFILFHGKRHPQDMGPAEVAAFLTHLAVERHVSASTQNQARSALLFLYQRVLQLQVDLPWLEEVVSARSHRKLPVVLTPTEVRALLHEMNGTMGLVASLLYGTGMRLLEGLRLRVKDVELERRELVVRDGKGGKGGKDRVTVLPENLLLPPQEQLTAARVGVAVGIPQPGTVHRSTSRGGPAPSPVRTVGATSRGRSGPACRHHQAMHAPCAEALVRHPPAAGRVRHPHGAGVAGPL